MSKRRKQKAEGLEKHKLQMREKKAKLKERKKVQLPSKKRKKGKK